MPAVRYSTAGAHTRRWAEPLSFPGAGGLRACRGRLAVRTPSNGEGGIRTPKPVRAPVFETGALPFCHLSGCSYRGAGGPAQTSGVRGRGRCSERAPAVKLSTLPRSAATDGRSCLRSTDHLIRVDTQLHASTGSQRIQIHTKSLAPRKFQGRHHIQVAGHDGDIGNESL